MGGRSDRIGSRLVWATILPIDPIPPGILVGYSSSLQGKEEGRRAIGINSNNYKIETYHEMAHHVENTNKNTLFYEKEHK